MSRDAVPESPAANSNAAVGNSNAAVATSISLESSGARESHLGRTLAVFASLLALLGANVFFSSLHLRRPLAIAIGLGLASLQATLAAGAFMHLFREKKLIQILLAFTALFFFMLLFIPLWTSPGGLQLH